MSMPPEIDGESPSNLDLIDDLSETLLALAGALEAVSVRVNNTDRLLRRLLADLVASGLVGETVEG